MAGASWILVVACLLVVGVTTKETEDVVVQATQKEDGATEVTSQEDRVKRQGFILPTLSSFTGRQTPARQQFFNSFQQLPRGSAEQSRNRQGGGVPGTNAVSLSSRFAAGGPRGSPRFTQSLLQTQGSLEFSGNSVNTSPSSSILRGQPTFQRQFFQRLSPQQLTSPSPAQNTPVILNNDPLGLFRGSQPARSIRPTTSLLPQQTFQFHSRSQNSLQQQLDIPQRLNRQQTPLVGQGNLQRILTPQQPSAGQRPAPQVFLQRPQTPTQGRSNRQTFLGPQGLNFARQPQFQIFQVTPTSGARQQPQVFRAARPQVLFSQPQAFQRQPTQQPFQSTFVTGPVTAVPARRPSTQTSFNRPLQTTSQPQFTPALSPTPQPLLGPQVAQQPSISVSQTPIPLLGAGQRQTQGQLFPGGFRIVADDTREDFDDTRELLFSRLAGAGVPGRGRVPVLLAGRPQVQPGRFNIISDDTREIFDDSRELIIGSQIAANLAGAGVPGRRRGPVIRPAVQPGRFSFISDDTREDLTTENVSFEVLLGGGVAGRRSQQVFTSLGRPSPGVDLDLTFEDFTREINSREFFG